MSDDLCWICKKNPSLRYGIVRFRFSSFFFNVPKDGMTCRECAKKNAIEIFKRHHEELLKRDAKVGIVVNWENYLKAQFDTDARRRHEETMNEINRLFLWLEIFSFKREGNWDVVDDAGVSMTPKPDFHVCFSRKGDAMQFAALAYGNTTWTWSVIKYGKTIGRSEVMKAVGK
jgi:hypothetical protein